MIFGAQFTKQKFSGAKFAGAQFAGAQFARTQHAGSNLPQKNALGLICQESFE